MRNSCRRVFVLAARNLKELVREPLGLVFMLGLPLVMEVLFYYIFHNMTAQFEMRYLATGIVGFAQSFLTLFTGILLALDRSSSFLTRLYVSPAKSYEFILGYTVALLPFSLVQSVLFFVVGGIIDPTFWSVGMIWGVLMSVVTSVLYIALGLLFGSVCNERAIGGVCSIVITGQSILSGMWFPLEGLPKGILVVMRVLPFKNVTMALQNVVNGTADPFADVLAPFLIVLAYTVVFQVVAILAFRRKMKAQ